MHGLPLRAELQHLVVFLGRIVTEGDPVVGITREESLGIFLVVVAEAVQCLGVVAELKVTQGDPEKSLLGGSPVVVFGEVFFVVLDGLLVLLPLVRIRHSLGELAVCHQEEHVGGQRGLVILADQRSENRLGFGEVPGCHGDGSLEKIGLGGVFSRWELAEVAIHRGICIRRAPHRSVGGADTEERVLADLRIGRFQQAFPDHDGLPFVIKLLVGPRLTDPDGHRGVREFLELSRRGLEFLDVLLNSGIRGADLHHRLGIGLERRLVLGNPVLQGGDPFFLQPDHLLLRAHDRIHLERLGTTPLGKQSIPYPDRQDVELHRVVDQFLAGLHLIEQFQSLLKLSFFALISHRESAA